MSPFVTRRLALVLLLLLAVLPASAAASERPNVVVIMTDDQTLADMAALPLTTSLIGDAGATFTRSYVATPLCCPSRATFLTGRYAHNHGVRTNTPPEGGVEALDAGRTLPVWLQAAGYDTSHVGKYLNGYGLREAPAVPPGWTDWHGAVDKSTYLMWGYTLNENGELRTYGDPWSEDPGSYQTDILRQKALDVIHSHAGEDGPPFFLSLAFVAPHGESTEPGATTTPYVRPAPRHRGIFSALQETDPAYDETDVRDKPPWVRRLRRLTPAMVSRIATDFRARRESLLAVDEAVAAIVAALGETGQLESTYVVFTSDNGFFQGEHRIPKGKYLPYDAASHVPLLVRGPGIAPGTISEELVANIDLAPTVLDAAGATAADVTDGRSLLPLARDPTLRSGRPVLHEGLVAGDIDRDGAAVPGRARLSTYSAIRTHRYLAVHWRGGARELYDLALDPHELRSRHADPRYASVRVALGAELRRLRTCVADACNRPFAPPRPVSR